MESSMSNMVLLGDEALAIGAVHAGISAAFAYPGTPSTEITEYLIEYSKKHGAPIASWSSNEKTAYEEALGVSFVGKRVLVSMKHVGLNVAADPFMNSALLDIKGGLVLAVADDPGMHSSQDEQDSRYYADFARIICLEPVNQQQAYDMTREAFDLSEGFHIPVMIRLTTRLAHSRAVVSVSEPRQENPMEKTDNPRAWMLLPGYARKRWADLLSRQKDFLSYTEKTDHNELNLNDSNRELGVITTGLGHNYFMENFGDFREKPSYLHIGAYPVPVEKVRALVSHVKKLVILEEGYPFVERYLRGYLPPPIPVLGKETGEVPPSGELNPDNVRKALGLPEREQAEGAAVELPGRPPQLCAGCPHADTYFSLNEALAGYDRSIVTADIGCYALGALPPYEAIETIVCMGASVSMAKGSAQAGYEHVVAVIGDSTFLHSGITPLVDAVAGDIPMTVLIVDNETVAMTGGQETILPSSKLEPLVRGIGVDLDHIRTILPLKKHFDENVKIIREEVEYPGVSVIIALRECVETAKRKRRS